MSHAARFPRIVAETLSGRSLVLPDMLDGRTAVLVLVFRRHVQPVVQLWTDAVAKLRSEYPDLDWYEIPMIAGGWRMISGIVDGGMRSGIPVDHHDHVATCYGSHERVRGALGIDDPDTAYSFLIDGRGEIRFSASGPPREQDLRELCNAVANAGTRV